MKCDFIHGSDAGLDDLCVQAVYLRSGNLPRAQVAGFGCTSLQQAAKNVCDVNGMFGVTLPVYHGKDVAYSRPADGECPTFFGGNGVNDYCLPSNGAVDIPDFSVSFREVGGLRKVDWLETGPMTNLASFAQLKPTIFSNKIRHVYSMGGAFEVPGLVGAKDPETDMPMAEFNWFHDPWAVLYIATVLDHSGKRLRVIPWDECLKLRLMKSRIDTLKGADAMAQHLLDATRAFFKLYGSEFTEHRGEEEAHVTCPDYVAYCAMLGEFGHFSERKIRISHRGEDFGVSRYVEAGLTVEVFTLDDPEDAVESFYERIAWR